MTRPLLLLPEPTGSLGGRKERDGVTELEPWRSRGVILRGQQSDMHRSRITFVGAGHPHVLICTQMCIFLCKRVNMFMLKYISPSSWTASSVLLHQQGVRPRSLSSCLHWRTAPPQVHSGSTQSFQPVRQRP